MTDKKYFLNLALIEGKFTEATNKSGITFELLVSILSKPSYNLVSEITFHTRCAKATVSRFLKYSFPDRDPIKDKKVDRYLLSTIRHRECPSCKDILPYEEFNKNITDRHGIQDFCRLCAGEYRRSCYAKNPGQEILNNSIRKRSLVIPPWQSKEELLEFYKNRPVGYHVDHIVPITNSLVCGLHCVANLQYLPALENLSKGNKFEPHDAASVAGSPSNC